MIRDYKIIRPSVDVLEKVKKISNKNQQYKNVMVSVDGKIFSCTAEMKKHVSNLNNQMIYYFDLKNFTYHYRCAIEDYGKYGK